jgi:hypothetical protein
MSKRTGSRQRELFARTKRPTVAIDPNHRLVQLADQLDWTEIEQRVQQVRRRKLKNRAGRPPHLRALIGAVLLMATRRMTYREAEDQIRHYGPARYLCDLTETDWTPDFTTIQDFTELMGEDGLRLINEHAVKWAVSEKLADPKLAVADTTAQEAAIAWPNEMGLMGSYMNSVGTASRKIGRTLRGFAGKVAQKFKRARQKLRHYRLFAKTKAARLKLISEMATLVGSVQQQLGAALQAAEGAGQRLKKRAKVAWTKLGQLHQTMKTLLPQIRYWNKTGRVAKNKIINLHIPELYAIVRGKVGKAVEFGLNWGITRLRGGYLLATRARDRRELVDAKFAVRAVDDLIGLFGHAPRAYAYDRAGHSKDNVAALQHKGVRHVGLAPRGRTAWSVSGNVKDRLIKERARVEGGIGSIKSSRYGFNRPAARSVAMMGTCGQRAVLGFNLNKLVREIARRDERVLVG